MKNHPSEISFYRLTTLPIIKAAPKLIEKIYYAKQRLVVIVEDQVMLAAIDNSLWTYSTKHFIAHATCNDPYPEDQPIYITDKLENPNNSTLIMVLGKVELDNFKADKYLYMFDGNDQTQLEFARNKWQKAKDSSNVTYWQQSENGAWEKQ